MVRMSSISTPLKRIVSILPKSYPTQLSAFCGYNSFSSTSSSFPIDTRHCQLRSCQFRKPIVSYNYIPVRFAGHSKWQNIAHTKSANDQKKAKIMYRLVRDVKFAIMNNGGQTDPKLNRKLADTLAEAKSLSIPLATLQKTIDGMKGGKDAAKTFVLPLKGPGGCFVLVEITGKNMHGAKSEVSAIIKKFGTTHADDSILYHFKYQGTIHCSTYNGKPVSEALVDEALVHAIDVGAEDVTFKVTDDGPVLEFVASPVTYLQTAKQIEELGYSVVYCEAEYLPNRVQELGDEEIEKVTKLMEKFGEKEQIIRVYDNIA